MKILSILFVCFSIFMAAVSFFYLIRFAYVHIKACVIRHKLSKLKASEKKDD